jgi:hypothetical protein
VRPGGEFFERTRLSQTADAGNSRIGKTGFETETPAMAMRTLSFIPFAVVLVIGLIPPDKAAAQRSHVKTCEEFKRHHLEGGCPPAQGSPQPQGRYLCYWHEPSGANGTCPVVSFARFGGPCTCRMSIGKDQVGRVGFRATR